MERRLLKAIINPAMGVTWILGLVLIWQGGWWTAGWLHGKVLLVVILSGLHGVMCAACGIRGGPQHASGALLPHPQRGSTVLMIGIVVLVIVEPF